MAVHDPKVAIHLALHDLKVAAPERFMALLKAMGPYIEHEVMGCVTAKPDFIHQQQGRAQLANEVARMLGECSVKAKLYKEQQDGQRTPITGG